MNLPANPPTTESVISEWPFVGVMEEKRENRIRKEPTVVEPKPPVECNWKQGQAMAVSTVKKLFGPRFHCLLPESGRIRISKIIPDESGRSYTIHAKKVGERTLEYSWLQFWWERGPPDARKEGFFYTALANNHP